MGKAFQFLLKNQTAFYLKANQKEHVLTKTKQDIKGNASYS